MDAVVTILSDGEPLPEKNNDHPLRGDYEGCVSAILPRIGSWYMKSLMMRAFCI